MTTIRSPARGKRQGTFSNLSTRREWFARYGTSLIPGWRQRHRFAEVERFCFFIGYPRSGHTLVGSLLNAHPEMVISHELDALGHVRLHFHRNQLYALLIEWDQVFGLMGRKWMGYQYVVPGQFQGRTTRLRVIGDKRGMTSSRRLGEHPELLGNLRRLVGVPVRVIHVTRNPYDNIATMTRRVTASRSHRRGSDVAAAPAITLLETIDRYAQLCAWVNDTKTWLADEELYEIAYERFVADPRTHLTEMCEFLGVTPSKSYLTDCAGVVWPSIRVTRNTVDWTNDARDKVEKLITLYPALAGYSLNS
jgi:hypothetical protein